MNMGEFDEKLNDKIHSNRDSVPFIVVVSSSNGYRTIISSSEEGQGLKATITMKSDIEQLTGKNSVEILY